MALSGTEQLDILKGEDGNLKPPSNLLIDLVKQIALIHTKFLYDNPKDTSGSPTGALYYSKVIGIAKRTISNDQPIINSLKQLVILVAGSTAVIADVTSKTDAEWETFILSHIGRAFELSGNCTKQEVEDYNALT